MPCSARGRSINERLHLRLWLTPLRFNNQPGVGRPGEPRHRRPLHAQTWNLTTHRVDPDVDEARDYVIEDLLQAERIEAAGYVDGVGAVRRDAPRHNLTGDPYFTDGKRAVVLLSQVRTTPKFVAWVSRRSLNVRSAVPDFAVPWRHDLDFRDRRQSSKRSSCSYKSRPSIILACRVQPSSRIRR